MSRTRAALLCVVFLLGLAAEIAGLARVENWPGHRRPSPIATLSYNNANHFGRHNYTQPGQRFNNTPQAGWSNHPSPQPGSPQVIANPWVRNSSFPQQPMAPVGGGGNQHNDWSWGGSRPHNNSPPSTNSWGAARPNATAHGAPVGWGSSGFGQSNWQNPQQYPGMRAPNRTAPAWGGAIQPSQGWSAPAVLGPVSRPYQPDAPQLHTGQFGAGGPYASSGTFHGTAGGQHDPHKPIGGSNPYANLFN